MNPLLEQALKGKLTKKELSLVPSSFDQVGDILIFSEFPKELKKKEKIIGNAFLQIYKNIKVVAKKTSKHQGRYRTKKVQIIAGEKRKETIHKENGVKIKLNIETCYFSPRSGAERLRIAKQIKPNELVLVMFSGVSPFPLVIEKNSQAKEIYAIEINPECHKYALQNLTLNKSKKITLFKGNVKLVLPKIKKKFNRIIMPLPKTADTYLGIAIKALKPKGIIHFYDFVSERDPDSSIKKIKKHCKSFKALNSIKCGQYAPGIYRVCIDFQPK